LVDHKDTVIVGAGLGLPLTLPFINPLTPNDFKRRRAVSPLKIKIPSENMREKPTNAAIIHSVY
jgi:hypothetical protein